MSITINHPLDGLNSPKIGKSLFIADLHLSEKTITLTNLFLKFVATIETEVKQGKYKLDNLFILGDFFNYWIGSDNISSWQEPIIAATNRLAQLTKIYFIPGNRDFLINKKDCNLFKFNLITVDYKTITLYGNKLTILHGDILCTFDKNYQKFRKLSRLAIIKKLYLALPLNLRQKLALGIKRQSNRHNKDYNNNPAIFDVSELAVKNLFQDSDSNVIIHGHTHRPRVHGYKNGKQFRYVLGDWHDDGAYYLEISSDGEINLRFFNQN